MRITTVRRATSYGFALVLWGSLAVWVSGCSGTTQSAVASVSASEAALAAAGKVILACYQAPKCAAVAPKPTIKAAYDSAYDAVTKAQAVADAGGTPDLTATTAAISALQSTIAQLPPATP